MINASSDCAKYMKSNIIIKKGGIIVFSVILLAGSVLLAGSIVKEEIENGQKEKSGESLNGGGLVAEDVSQSVKNKEDANKALVDIDKLVDSVGESDLR